MFASLPDHCILRTVHTVSSQRIYQKTNTEDRSGGGGWGFEQLRHCLELDFKQSKQKLPKKIGNKDVKIF